VREAVDTYFGTIVRDQYRWMEEAGSAQFAAWIATQHSRTRAMLDRLPVRTNLCRRIEELSNAAVAILELRRVRNQYFYLKLAPGENQCRLFVRDGTSGDERLLADPSVLPAGARHSIDSFSPSCEGRYVSYVVSASGTETGELRVVDTQTGRLLDERIDRVRFGAGSWLPGEQAFTYQRLQAPRPGAPATERFQHACVYLHAIGSDPAADVPVFGRASHPDLVADAALLPFVDVAVGSAYAFGIVVNGASPSVAVYVTPWQLLAESRVPWRKLADNVVSVNERGDVAYMLTYRDAPRGRLVRTTMSDPPAPLAPDVLPPGETILVSTAMAQDALYVQAIDAGRGRLLRLGFDTDRLVHVELPADGAISGMTSDPREPGVIVNLQSWTESPAYYEYQPARSAVSRLALQPRSPVDFSGIEAIEVMALSHDGTRVPLSIVQQRGSAGDSARPALLEAYGAYGVCLDAVFNPLSLAWLECNGVLAFAHVRGGGEYGRAWHAAGQKANKPNAWRDFIACAEYLVSQGYTSPSRLAVEGTSAGAIVVGNALVERPDLFAAAVIRAGFLNPLRSETTANGVPNIPEFGSCATEQGFRALLAMDPYQRIENGTAYPAVLLTHGINDARVEPWMSGKFAARLQAATSSGKPILLRIDADAGHGIGTTRRQWNHTQADIFAFLFEQLGIIDPPV